MPTYALQAITMSGGNIAVAAPTVIDAGGTSATATITNNGALPVVVAPLGWEIAANRVPHVIPLYASVRTTVVIPAPRDGWRLGSYNDGEAPKTSLDVTLSGSSPAAAPGPGLLTIRPNSLAGSVNIVGGSWFTDRGLKTAATLPIVFTGAEMPVTLYPAAGVESFTITTPSGSKFVEMRNSKVVVVELRPVLDVIGRA